MNNAMPAIIIPSFTKYRRDVQITLTVVKPKRNLFLRLEKSAAAPRIGAMAAVMSIEMLTAMPQRKSPWPFPPATTFLKYSE